MTFLKEQEDPRTNQELRECFEEVTHRMPHSVIDAIVEGISDAFTQSEIALKALVPEMLRRKLI